MRFKSILLSCLLFAGCAGSAYYIDDVYHDAKGAYESGEYQMAVEKYQQFIDEYPDSAMTEVALYYQAESYRKAGDKDNALKAYQKLVEQYEIGSWAEWAKEDIKELQSNTN